MKVLSIKEVNSNEESDLVESKKYRIYVEGKIEIRENITATIWIFDCDGARTFTRCEAIDSSSFIGVYSGFRKIIRTLAMLKFGRYEHIASLLKLGTIHMSTLRTFIKDEDNWRNDSKEGLSFLARTKRVETRLEGPYEVRITTEEEIEKINRNDLDKPIYCMSHLTNRGDIDRRFIEKNEAVCIIRDFSEFLRRIKRVLEKEKSIDFESRKVEYYDDKYSGEIGLARKRKIYESQNEQRFIMHSKSEDFQFSIGSIEDIATIVDLRKKEEAENNLRLAL